MDTETFNKFSPLDFIDLSKKFISYFDKNGWNNSSFERNIYGRIYYGTFLFVKEWLSKKTDFNVKNNGEDHKNIPNYIESKGPFDEEMNKIIADNIRKLRKLRNQSDYYLKVPNENSKEYKRWNHEDLKNAIYLSEYIINSFKNN